MPDLYQDNFFLYQRFVYIPLIVLEKSLVFQRKDRLKLKFFIIPLFHSEFIKQNIFFLQQNLHHNLYITLKIKLLLSIINE